MERLLTTAEAAAYLEISPGSLLNSRSRGAGPDSCGKDSGQRGRPNLYAQADLDLYREQLELAEELRVVSWRLHPLPVLRAAKAVLDIDPSQLAALARLAKGNGQSIDAFMRTLIEENAACSGEGTARKMGEVNALEIMRDNSSARGRPSARAPAAPLAGGVSR